MARNVPQITPEEYLLAKQLHDIWRGNPKKGGKSFAQLTYAKQQRWLRVAHAVRQVARNG